MQHSVERLSSFLREEVSAVEAYQHVLSLVKSGKAREELRICYQDHLGRLQALREFIGAHGDPPKEVPGRRGFARIPGFSEALADRSMLEILEDGEELAFQHYDRALAQLNEEDRRFVEEKVMPSQRATWDRLRSLRGVLH